MSSDTTRKGSELAITVKVRYGPITPINVHSERGFWFNDAAKVQRFTERQIGRLPGACARAAGTNTNIELRHQLERDSIPRLADGDKP